MTCVLYAGKARDAEAWIGAVRALRPELDITADIEGTDPAKIDILLYEPSGPVKDLTPYSGIPAIQSLWAGVETLLDNPTLPKSPALLRMVEPGLTEGMTDYCVGHVMRVHLGMDEQRAQQSRKEWLNVAPPLSRNRKVAILGLGALGVDLAQKLATLRFNVLGWSRNEKTIAGVKTFHGDQGLAGIIAQADIIIILVPLTPQTTGLFDAERLEALPDGAHIINVARGPIIEDDALLAALNSGKIASATLDVFNEEPLPQSHPYWEHPSVTITPHTASATRIQTAAKVIVEQIELFETGKPFINVVDRSRGY